MNICALSGRLTRDPEIRYVQSNNKSMCVARFSLAVDRRFSKGSGQNADFPNMVAFGKTGEFVEKYCKKGTKLIVRSHVQTGSYINKDGIKVFTTEFAVDEVEFAESRSAAQANQESAPQGSAPTTQQPQTAAPVGYNPGPLPKTVDDFMGIPDTDMPELPFA